jgi:hypothetical protein
MMTEPPLDPRFPTIAPPISPAAREQVIAQLTDRYANDHLTLEEFERRAAAAYAATTPAALIALTADLPSTLPAARSSGSATHIGVVLGSVVRSLFEVPSQLEVRSLLGNLELDLTRARFAPGVTEISLRALMGNIEIHLPANVGVEDHVSTVLGSFEYRRHPRAASWVEGSRNASVVRFTGRVTMSAAEVVIRVNGDEREAPDDSE